MVDLLAALVGFAMEQREDWRLLWWLPLQRFGYRQLMYYVVVRSSPPRCAARLWAGASSNAMVQSKRVMPFVCNSFLIPHRQIASPRG